MITEVVEFELLPGSMEAFAAGVEASRELFTRAPGFRSLELHCVIERPDVALLLIVWDSVADHMDKFQKSPDFARWRANVGPYFADKPRLQHTETTLRYA